MSSFSYPHYTGGQTETQKVSCPWSHSKLLPGLGFEFTSYDLVPIFLYDTKSVSGKVERCDWQSWFSWGPWGGRLWKAFNTWMFGLSAALIMCLASWWFYPMSEKKVDGNTTFKHWKLLVSSNYCFSTLHNFVMNWAKELYF